MKTGKAMGLEGIPVGVLWKYVDEDKVNTMLDLMERITVLRRVTFFGTWVKVKVIALKTTWVKVKVVCKNNYLSKK